MKSFCGLSSETLEEINTQFSQLFIDLGILRPPLKVDHTTCYFLCRHKFGLAYLLREILEEEEESLNLSSAVWKEFKYLHCHFKGQLNPDFSSELASYFQMVPSTILASSRSQLVTTTVKLIKWIVISLDDNEVSESITKSGSFECWLFQFYTFHEDGKLLSGFRGKSCDPYSNNLAIYLNRDTFSAVTQETGLVYIMMLPHGSYFLIHLSGQSDRNAFSHSYPRNDAPSSTWGKRVVKIQ
eukprot:TRINITY_DN1716_c0_g1_i7.p1 TRINITY_DN1716_c0_g1~~TRINITY_DN1716_c0_g1_i7.p1  ORF type:complete len:241 (-),score=35.98 TRINITY_DN1716_c0_g1_i7:761-1483(-)